MATMSLLPAKEGTCPVCATSHLPDEAHNAQSLFYGMRFKMLHHRDPTWADAVAHCSDAMKTMWTEELKRLDAWTEPEDGEEPIAEHPSDFDRSVIRVESTKKNDAADRCADFIADVVEVCKKHRVMLKLDDMCDFEAVEFEEHPENDQYGFILGASDLEDSVRLAVWDIVHPSA